MDNEKSTMKNIYFLGFVSFFSDISSEMVYPIIPLYLTSVLGTSTALVGVIEGIAESVASLLKVFSGYISDRYNHKKAIAFSGYASGLVYKLALLFASSWVGILIARIIDRIGKGIRTAPRDVMVSESSPKDQMGKSFGIHKAMDTTGSAIGIILSFILLKSIGDTAYRTVFYVSIIPVILALMMFIFVKEKPRERVVTKREPIFKNIKGLDRNLKLYLVVAFVFTLGNSSNTFLLLRATDTGFSSTDTILLYFIYNIVTAVFAIPFGKGSDKKGRKKILITGYLTFAAVYFMFGFASNKIMITAAFVLYGFYTAMVAGVERAFIAEISPKELKGTMLGLHSTIVGIALLPASTIAGALWDNVSASAPFVFGASLSLAAALILGFFFRTKKAVE